MLEWRDLQWEYHRPRWTPPSAFARGRAVRCRGLTSRIVLPANESDTAILFQSLNAACQDPATSSDTAVLDVLCEIEGPFAFIFWEARKRRLWFGRDRLGRRSLVTSPLATYRHTCPLCDARN